MKTDAAFALEEMDIHIFEGKESLPSFIRRFLAVGGEHPWFHIAPKLAAVTEIEVVGENIAIVEKPEPTVRRFADATLRKFSQPRRIMSNS